MSETSRYFDPRYRDERFYNPRYKDDPRYNNFHFYDSLPFDARYDHPSCLLPHRVENQRKFEEFQRREQSARAKLVGYHDVEYWIRTYAKREALHRIIPEHNPKILAALRRRYRRWPYCTAVDRYNERIIPCSGKPLPLPVAPPRGYPVYYVGRIPDPDAASDDVVDGDGDNDDDADKDQEADTESDDAESWERRPICGRDSIDLSLFESSGDCKEACDAEADGELADDGVYDVSSASTSPAASSSAKLPGSGSEH